MTTAAHTLLDPAKTPKEAFVTLARKGIPLDQAFDLAELYELTKVEMAKILGTSERTLRRRIMLSNVESDRLLRFVKLMRLADDYFESTDAVAVWIRSPNMALDKGLTPLSLLDTDDGIDQVKTVLGRLIHGVYS